jgi:hypothetical protein
MKIFLVILIWAMVLIAFNMLWWEQIPVDGYRSEIERFDIAFKAMRNDRKEMKERLLEFKTKNNRYPTNDEGLSVVARSEGELTTVPGFLNYREDPLHSRQYEGRIVDIVEAPYIYENRIGLSQSAFEQSPVKNDPKEYYSTTIDDNVYIYSVGALALYESYLYRTKSSPMISFYVKIAIFCFIETLLLFLFAFFSIKARSVETAEPQEIRYGFSIFLSLCAILFVVFVCHIGLTRMSDFFDYRNFRPFYRTYKNDALYYCSVASIVILIIMLIISELTSVKKPIYRLSRYCAYFLFAVITALIFQPAYITCYETSHIFGWRRKESYPKYLELLAKYRDSRVIKQETFDKIKQALDLELEKEKY